MSTTTDEAAQLLLAAWKGATRINGLPSRCRPADLDQGYAIQDALLLATGEALGGHKIAATSVAGQQHIGITHPITGGLLSSQIRSPGAQVSLSGNQMCAAEAEFVFEFKARVSPRSTQYSRVEVLQAVGALRLGIEIPDSRLSGFAGAGAPQLVADNACAHVFVLGQAVASGWRQNDLAAQRVALCVDGDEVAVGCGAHALGDPRDALVWFVNHLSSRGKAIEPGEFVTTGVCAGPVTVKPGQSVIARFDGYGEVNLRLTGED